MTRMRAGAVALLLTAGTGLAITGPTGSGASAATKPAPAPPPVAAPVAPAQAFVQRAYDDLLGHTPDAAGAAYWVQRINAGLPHAYVAGNLTSTNDYRSQVVQRAYLQTLGHNADPAGLQFWIGWMARGGNVNQLVGSLFASNEVIGQFGSNYDAFVKAAYQTLLGRGADAAGETYWDGRLAAGDPMWHVAASLVSGSEWFSNRVVYDYVYYHVGFPDPSGLAFWVHSMQAGIPEARLVAQLVGTDNYAAFATANP